MKDYLKDEITDTYQKMLECIKREDIELAKKYETLWNELKQAQEKLN